MINPFALLRFFVHFIISFCVLSIPIGGSSLFSHAQAQLSPYFETVSIESKKLYKKSADAFSQYANSLFGRFSWSSDGQSDRVRTQKSSPQKNNSSWRGKNQEELDEEYEAEEKRSLERLLQEI